MSDYLDLCNTSNVDGHTLSDYDVDATNDINSHFAKKKNPKSKKVCSICSITVCAYVYLYHSKLVVPYYSIMIFF